MELEITVEAREGWGQNRRNSVDPDRRWKTGPESRGPSATGNSSAGSRVSLVCNVCSRLLPKEWFAERPMASARANSRVPQPRHLCIIMLRPPLLPSCVPHRPLLYPPSRGTLVCPPPPAASHRPASPCVPPRPLGRAPIPSSAHPLVLSLHRHPPSSRVRASLPRLPLPVARAPIPRRGRSTWTPREIEIECFSDERMRLTFGCGNVSKLERRR